MKNWIVILAALNLAFMPGCTSTHKMSDTPEKQAMSEAPGTRIFKPFIGDRWIGNAICYSPYRDGQSPDGGPWPTREELREDLHIMARHWNLIRMYGSRGPAETVLELIREDKLPIKMLLGAWIHMEERFGADGAVVERFPDTVGANEGEVKTAIRLANQYPDIVLAVSVGNETQVSWSAHRLPAELLISYIREARAGVKVPVTTADDFTYWDKPESKLVADEIDFIVMHAHPVWCGMPLEKGLPFTREQREVIMRLHPNREVVIGETGWATRKHNEGEQARLIVGALGEDEQQQFYDEFLGWTTANHVTNFVFEAFDENWKGGPHPDEVEKHWGLYNADRTPKKVLR